ncbi:DciA family protein [Acidobacteriota bacterium]
MEDFFLVLKALRNSLGPEERALLALPLIKARWSDMTGRQLADLSRPSRLEQGVLTVSVWEASVAAELKKFGPDIKAKCNIMLGDRSITSIEFEPGVRTKQDQVKPTTPVELPEEWGSHIKDPEIRKIFRKACAAYLSAHKSDRRDADGRPERKEDKID